MYFHNIVFYDLNKARSLDLNKDRNKKEEQSCFENQSHGLKFFLFPKYPFRMKAYIAVLSQFVWVSKVKLTHLFDTKYMLSYQEVQLMSNW